jgi:uncharacterized protein (DUF433 family)
VLASRYTIGGEGSPNRRRFAFALMSSQQALDEVRFGREYYSRADVARLLDVPVGTVGNWIRGYRYPVRDEMRSAGPLIVPPKGGRWLSFANLIEAHTVAAFRASGLSMQKIRPALADLVRQLGIDHPLASRHLLTDGAELFFRYLRTEGQSELVTLLNVSRGGQVVFDEVVDRYLRRVDWAADDYAERLWPVGREQGVVIDPRRGFGQPIIARRGIRVEDVVHRLQAGEPMAVVADDFGLEQAEVEAAERFKTRILPRAA